MLLFVWLNKVIDFDFLSSGQGGLYEYVEINVVLDLAQISSLI